MRPLKKHLCEVLRTLTSEFILGMFGHELTLLGLESTLQKIVTFAED